jgi:hypothetical protein
MMSRVAGTALRAWTRSVMTPMTDIRELHYGRAPRVVCRCAKATRTVEQRDLAGGSLLSAGGHKYTSAGLSGGKGTIRRHGGGNGGIHLRLSMEKMLTWL